MPADEKVIELLPIVAASMRMAGILAPGEGPSADDLQFVSEIIRDMVSPGRVAVRIMEIQNVGNR